MPDLPIDRLASALRQNGLVRFMDHYNEMFPETHMKDLVIDSMDDDRRIMIQGREVVNFGSDSFLGLDRDPRVLASIVRGVTKWGAHNGASRAFSSVRANEVAEEKLASWLGTESALIFPSVTLANMGAIPGLVGKQDLLVVDEHAHNSIQEGARIAKGNGVRTASFSHCDPEALEQVLRSSSPYRVAIVAIDGIYSMSGALPPLAKLHQVCLRNDAVLYVDDAHATAVLGKHGRGTVFDALGSYDNTLVIGSLSKGFSCAGGFIGCPEPFKRLLKIRSNTYIFGGPVVPPYLEAVCTVCDILMSADYEELVGRLRANCRLLTSGARSLGLDVLGGETPIISIMVGDEADTLQAGHLLFDRGFYVQSVTFPAVPYHAGILRIQVNSNHSASAIEGLIDALAWLKTRIPFQTPQHLAA